MCDPARRASRPLHERHPSPAHLVSHGSGGDEPATPLQAQLAFLLELDRLKTIQRQSRIADGSRRENSAEHSWHLALFALVLSAHADTPVDPARVVAMLLVHDIVEIDAGDAPLHAPGIDRAALARAEQEAADRIFALLPPGQSTQFRALWDEFEAATTPEARFARALDRLQPLLLNTVTGGGTWTENDVPQAEVTARMRPPIEAGSRALWAEAERLIQEHFAP